MERVMKMSILFDEIFRFGYHDTELSSIIIEGRTVMLFFKDGLYNLDSNGVELDKSKPITLNLEIGSVYGEIYLLVEAIDFSYKKDRYIEYNELRKLIQKKQFPIHNLYYSRFNNTILIEGSLPSGRVLITIQGCEKASFTFLN